MDVVFENKLGELWQYNRNQALIEIANELDKLWEYFDARPNDTQLQDLAEIIYDAHPALDVVLFHLAVKRIKSAHYAESKVYGKPNPQIVMDVLKLVWDEHEVHIKFLEDKNRRWYNGVDEPIVLTPPENLVSLDKINKDLEAYRNRLSAKQTESAQVLTMKIIHKRSEAAEALVAIESNRGDAIEKTLEYLYKNNRDEYDEFVKRLEETEKELGL